MADYIECELTLSDYNQAVLKYGDDRYDGRPALNEAQEKLLEAALDSVRYGTLLFEALMPPQTDLATGYRIALAQAIRESKSLRFRLCVDANAPEKLHDLDWELLYDPQKKITLSRSGEIAFSRYTVARGKAAELIVGKPKLLVVVSNPVDLIEQGLEEVSAQALKNILASLTEWLEVEYLEGRATPGRINQRVREGGFHLLHIQAHGKKARGQGRASILLETDEGKANFVDPDLFWETVEGIPRLSLLTLITCYSGTAAQEDPFAGIGPRLARQGLPAVVAMRNTISFTGAERFCRSFYRELVNSGLVDVAANEARKQMYLASTQGRDWGRPAVFMRLKDGKLWEPRQNTIAVTSTPNDEFDWSMILQRLRKNQLVPILGPEINRGLLLAADEISERWAKQFKYPGDDINDLPRVAKFVETTKATKASPNYHKELLIDTLKNDLLERQKAQHRELLKDLSLTEVIEDVSQSLFGDNDPHRILAELPISTYITANYDSFTYQAIKYLKRDKNPQREHCQWRQLSGDTDYFRLDSPYQKLKGSKDAPLIFHLYGRDDNPRTLVLTEDDYLDFLRLVSKDSERIPQFLKSTMTEAMLLFLGFNIRDLNFRVLFKGLIAPLRDDTLGRVAVLQIEPDENYSEHVEKVKELRSFMAKDCSNLDIAPYWGTVGEFLAELRKKKDGN
ncbi:MAG: hypothetical protein V7641_2686 [Blastocatellia bacterium]